MYLFKPSAFDLSQTLSVFTDHQEIHQSTFGCRSHNIWRRHDQDFWEWWSWLRHRTTSWFRFVTSLMLAPCRSSQHLIISLLLLSFKSCQTSATVGNWFMQWLHWCRSRCNHNWLEKKTYPNLLQGEDRSANGGAASHNLPEVGGSHGGSDGQTWRGWKQGALPCVTVLLLYPGHLYQDCLAGWKSQLEYIVDFHLDQFHFGNKCKAGLRWSLQPCSPFWSKWCKCRQSWTSFQQGF